jgi:hypothetical protein
LDPSEAAKAGPIIQPGAGSRAAKFNPKGEPSRVERQTTIQENNCNEVAVRVSQENEQEAQRVMSARV